MRRRSSLKSSLLLLVMGISLLVLAACGNAESSSLENGESKPVTLKLAHQWSAPTGAEGDYRSLLAEKFAEEVDKASDGDIKIQIYPANSLVKANEQYDSLKSGAVDMAIWAPFYDAGKVPEFSISLMPGIIKTFDQAWQWKDEEIGQEVNSLLEDNGVKNLVWAWGTMAIASKDKKIVNPEDLKGLTFRGAGKESENMLAELGAGVTSMPSSEIYSALQTNVLDGTLTSFDSFLSYRIYEVVDHFNYTGEQSFLYSMNPLVISNNTWEGKLSEEQREIVEKVSKDLQGWVKEAAIDSNKEVADIFRDNGVEVHEMTVEESEKWFEAAQPIVEDFSAVSEKAKKLVDLAKDLN